MSKELNIIEASNMPENTLFAVKIDCYYKHDDAIRIRDNTKLKAICTDAGIRFLEYSDIEKASKSLLNAKFIPIPKPVSFMEAIKEYSEHYRNIYCKIGNTKKLYEYNPIGLKNGNQPISSYEILNGEWYIED